MKYIIVIGDGMADFPIKELNNKTVLEYATKPIIDYFAKNGKTGLALTVPDGYIPGSDVANMSIFGYDPRIYYTGRSPLEALSMKVSLEKGDIAFRCNFITISPKLNFNDSTILDYSGGHISSEESSILIKYLQESLSNVEIKKIKFYSGVGYRNLAVTKNNLGADLKCIPPHDIIGKQIYDFYPKGIDDDFFINLMKKSYDLLSNHPINIKRKENNQLQANCIWFWGQGVVPKLESFYNLYNKRGSVISAIDLLKGIGIASGLEIIEVENATGFLDTNYYGKVCSALNSLNINDVVFIHIEAPDECGHIGDYKKKITAIEDIDKYILKPIFNYINQSIEPVKLLFLPDHPTPVSIKTHTSDPVPFLIYDSRELNKDSVIIFDEYSVKSGFFGLVNAWELMKILFQED